MIRSCRGFTLIEILVAILIGSLVLSSVYGIFSSVSEARNRLEMEGEKYHQVRVFFDRIGGELSSLRLSPVGDKPVFASGRTLNGDFFFEFNTELVSPLVHQHGGVSRVSYEVREAEAETVLLRSERVVLADLAPSEPQPFIDGLSNIAVRYYQAGNWHDSWSNQSPPQLIEIFLEMKIDERTIPFRSSFVLPEVGG